MATERLSLRIDANLKKNLEREARREERSASYLAVKAIEAMLRDRAEKRTAIRAAVSGSRRGCLHLAGGDGRLGFFLGEDSELPPPEPDVQIASQ